jgi:hypothetical protein
MFWRIEGCFVRVGNRRTLLRRPARGLLAVPATMCPFLIRICILNLDHKNYLCQEAREFKWTPSYLEMDVSKFLVSYNIIALENLIGESLGR